MARLDDPAGRAPQPTPGQLGRYLARPSCPGSLPQQAFDISPWTKITARSNRPSSSISKGIQERESTCDKTHSAPGRELRSLVLGARQKGSTASLKRLPWRFWTKAPVRVSHMGPAARLSAVNSRSQPAADGNRQTFYSSRSIRAPASHGLYIFKTPPTASHNDGEESCC